MEGFGGSDTAREAEDGKRGGGRKLPATCLKGTQLPDFKNRKKPGRTRPSAEIVECEIGKFGGHENRRSSVRETACGCVTCGKPAAGWLVTVGSLVLLAAVSNWARVVSFCTQGLFQGTR